MLAGQYDARTDQIDPAGLIRHAGGDFVRDRWTGIDRRRQTVTLSSGGTLEYDLLSLNVGSQVNARHLPGAETHAWPVKPIRNLWRVREELEQRFEQSSEGPVRVVVVGGGPTGCEVAACANALARRSGATVQVTLVSRNDRLLAELPSAASRKLTKALSRRGVDIVLSEPVSNIEEDAVVITHSRRLHADIVVLATGLEPPSFLHGLGLPLDPDGGLRVGSTLQSVADDRIFATGDCAGLDGHRLPKLGVFGVRQAPILLHNLAALLQGRPLKQYRPQKRCLMILNLGCGRALAVYGNLHWLGRLSFWVKDRIDRRFLAGYRH
jgi:NADH dehydrogenase FAD-containing subunit